MDKLARIDGFNEAAALLPRKILPFSEVTLAEQLLQ